jgi:ribosomal-protein-alanine N-acetyltransferase
MAAADAPAVCWIARVALGSGRTEGDWRRDLEHPGYRMRVADDRGRVVGFSACSVAAGECTVMHVAVAPECRRNGIGQALLKAALEQVAEHGAAHAVLEVRRSNRAARALYQRFGFHEVGVRPGYYQGPVEDALVLRAEL